jgi:carboxypeptidase Taq
MGNLIGAQIWQTLQRDLDTDSSMSAGNFGPILSWLQEKIYRHGRTYLPKDLIQGVTGHQLSASPWLAYAKEKYGGI